MITLNQINTLTLYWYNSLKTYIITALRHVMWILIWNTYKISYSGLRCRKRLIILVRIPDMQAGTLPTAGTLRPSTVQGKMFPLQSGPCVTDVITTKVRGLIYMYCLTVRPFITIKIMLPKLLQRNNSNAFSTRANALLLLYFDI